MFIYKVHTDLLRLDGKSYEHRFSKLKLTWWKRLIDCWVVVMFRPQGRKLAYWLGIMEYRTFTYGQDSRDIQIHSLPWQRQQKSMTVKQTTARKNPKEWAIGETGIDIYTLICIKWITNKNLLYKK